MLVAVAKYKENILIDRKNIPISSSSVYATPFYAPARITLIDNVSRTLADLHRIISREEHVTVITSVIE